MTEPARSLPRHFNLLDAARGLASLAVVLFHWKHFHGRDYYDRPDWMLPSYPSGRPLAWAFGPVYEHADLSVDLFFPLSGFIFFWLYSDRIAGGATSARNFALLRFSRLYPLHLATLLAVAAMQAAYHSTYSRYFIYEHNDARNFLLQLAFASQ